MRRFTHGCCLRSQAEPGAPSFAAARASWKERSLTFTGSCVTDPNLGATIWRPGTDRAWKRTRHHLRHPTSWISFKKKPGQSSIGVGPLSGAGKRTVPVSLRRGSTKVLDLMDAYSRAWRLHRIWRRLPHVGFAISAVLIVGIDSRALEFAKPYASFYAAPFGLALVASAFGLAMFRCPRCGKRFHASFITGTFLYRREQSPPCVNCGQPLYGEP